MKTRNDLTETERIQYDKIILELEALEPLLDTYDFKNKVEEKKRVLALYLDLRKKQHALIPLGRKDRFKDKAIKEVFDYSVSALELKLKSRVAYERMRNNFNKLFASKLEKAKMKGKKG